MEEGIVKIGDYGLAKLITPSQGTEHSESIGTCHYMAPEIGSGKYNKPIDVYAIGVILYEMLTGRVPFEGETVNEVLMKHLTARPDVSMLAEPYRTIVAKALAKDPNAAAEPGLRPAAARATRRASRRSGSSARPRRRRRRGRPAAAPPEEDDPADRGRGAGLLHRPRDPAAPPAGADPGAAAAGQLRASAAGPQRRARVPAANVQQASYQAPARGRGRPRASRSSPPPRRPPRRPRDGPSRPSRPPHRRRPAAAAARAAAMPSGRVRFAELAGSMLWAAPVLAPAGHPRRRRAGDRPVAAAAAAAYLYAWPCWGPGRPSSPTRRSRPVGSTAPAAG